jgi:hypothetical protein
MNLGLAPAGRSRLKQGQELGAPRQDGVLGRAGEPHPCKERLGRPVAWPAPVDANWEEFTR